MNSASSHTTARPLQTQSSLCCTAGCLPHANDLPAGVSSEARATENLVRDRAQACATAIYRALARIAEELIKVGIASRYLANIRGWMKSSRLWA